jgi:hypothetical protein
MSTSQPFWPHGLIKTPLLEALYLAAYTPYKNLSEAHHKLHSTLALMQVLFYFLNVSYQRKLYRQRPGAAYSQVVSEAV